MYEDQAPQTLMRLLGKTSVKPSLLSGHLYSFVRDWRGHDPELPLASKQVKRLSRSPRRCCSNLSDEFSISSDFIVYAFLFIYFLISALRVPTCHPSVKLSHTAEQLFLNFQPSFTSHSFASSAISYFLLQLLDTLLSER